MKSMTGYGRGAADGSGVGVTVEIKAVNNRFLDVSFKLPRAFSRCEDALSKIVSSVVKRGFVDVYVSINQGGLSGKRVALDVELAAQYIAAAKKLRVEFLCEDDFNLTALMRMPEVLRLENITEGDEFIDELIYSAAKAAIADLDRMREAEGSALKNDLSCTIQRFVGSFEQLKKLAPLAEKEYAARLKEKLDQIVPNVDENRLLTEVALFADKVDVNEELTRIGSHLAQLDQLINSGDEVGRKLDFLNQELLREVNTIGSKSRDYAITSLVVSLKNELEKLKEQIRNIE